MKRKNLLRITGSIALLLSIANINQTNVDKIDASNELAIENDLNALINSYYNNGVYLKETIINLNTDAVNELNQHGGFHADADDLVRITQFNGDTLTMTIPGNDTYESNYGTDSETGALTHWGKGGTPKVVITKPTSAETAGNWKNWEEDGMEGYYWTLKDIVAVDTHAWSLNNGVYSSSDETVVEWFKAIVAPCYVGFTTSTGNYITLSSVEIEEVENTLQLRLFASEGDATKLTNDNLLFAQATISQEHTYHVYDSNHECVFCGDITLTQLGSHTGTATWSYLNEEKITSNAVFHENISNVPVDANGSLNDFSIGIKYFGWGSNAEHYLFTLSSTSNVLIFKIQLGVEPWTHYATNITLSDEHKARLASEEGLDYVVYYNHDTKKLDLYVYTGHEVQLLYEVDMHTNTMNNFYQTTYACSGASVTVKSATYKTYDTDINTIFNELNLELKEHKYVDVEVTSATCSTDGVVAHKACIMCDAKVDMEGNPITDAQTEVMWGHTYATDTNTCTVCGKENPLTVHATHTYNGAEKWDYTDAYFTHVIHENIKYNSVDGNGALYDFSESIKYVGWGSNAYAYTLKLSSSSNVVTVSFGGNTYTLEEEYVNQLKSENGLDLFVSFEKTTKALKVYARNSTGVNELISFVCYDSKAAGFYETSITAHNENVTVNSTIYKVTGEFDAASDLKNL